MNKEDTLKNTIIGGLVVSAITVFFFTPLGEELFHNENERNNELPNDDSIKYDNFKFKNKSNEKNNLDHKSGAKFLDSAEIISKISDYNFNSANLNLKHESKPDNVSEFDEFLNTFFQTSFENSANNTNILVTILDESKKIMPSLSSSISSIYNKTGVVANYLFIQNSCIHHPRFDELINGNTEIIEKLNLQKYADYFAFGRLQYSFQKGTLVEGTIVCNSTLIINIISTKQKCLLKSFTLSGNGNGSTKEQALEYSINKLLGKYDPDYSSL